jgi:two-component system cell cycle sensor histidine kinase/response regulator CckA
MKDGFDNDVLGLLEAGRFQVDIPEDTVRLDARALEILGIRHAMRLSELLSTFVPSDQRRSMRHHLERVGEDGSFRLPSVPIRREDGSQCWVRIAGRLDGDAQGPRAARGVLIDTTAEEQLRRQLVEVERLETLGRFSSGISHNFNNMLLVIRSCLADLREGLTTDEVPSSLQDALDATQRASLMVRQLADMARPGGSSEASVTCRVDQAAERVIRLTRRNLPSWIELELSIRSQATVRIRPGALDQVLQNLILNARDALVTDGPPSPKVRVEVHQVEAFGDTWVELTVSDNGPGLPPQVVSHLFEPFVTTKGAAGTGLGLASSAAIVRQQDGYITYRASPSGGAEFLVQLPVADPTPRVDAPPQGDQQTTGSLRVLLVDDEEAIRRVVCRSLARRGIEVATAESVEAARARLTDDAPIDVILLDRSVLPRACGEPILELRTACPNVSILFFSGQGVTADERSHVDGVIRKPIDMERLARQIRHCALDKHR